MSKILESYLTNYAEPETTVLDFPRQSRYDYALVVPAFSESIQCINMLLDNIRSQVLLILVANAPPEQTETTQNFMRELLQKFPLKWSNQHLKLLEFASEKDILLVDRCSEGRAIPKHQGVGLARKIGFDLAVKLIAQGVVTSPWINTTDADVTLPRDYPNHESGSSIDAAARIYPYRHKAGPALDQAMRLYDFALEYYLAGLRYAGSPYAYHAIGSTMCIHYQSYVKVRGFPKKAAAEDFYMLNKLAKVGSIESLESPVLGIQARLSDRVPFGTGHALQAILKLDDPLKDYLYYNPHIFLLLRNWLEVIPEIWPNRHQVDMGLLASKADNSQDILQDCLVEMGILQVVRKGLDQYRSASTFERYLHQWFDAFRTLKFIHQIRDRHLESVPITALSSAPFVPKIDIRALGGEVDSRINDPAYQREDHDPRI